MRKLEAVRMRHGMTKAELAAELETTKDALRAWMTGRTVGRKEAVVKIKEFSKAEISLGRSSGFLEMGYGSKKGFPCPRGGARLVTRNYNCNSSITV